MCLGTALTVHLLGDLGPHGACHVGVGGQAGEGRVHVLEPLHAHHPRQRHHHHRRCAVDQPEHALCRATCCRGCTCIIIGP